MSGKSSTWKKNCTVKTIKEFQWTRLYFFKKKWWAQKIIYELEKKVLKNKLQFSSWQISLYLSAEICKTIKVRFKTISSSSSPHSPFSFFVISLLPLVHFFLFHLSLLSLLFSECSPLQVINEIAFLFSLSLAHFFVCYNTVFKVSRGW